MHVPFAGVPGALEESLEQPEDEEPWDCLEQGPEPRNGLDAIEERLGRDVDGHWEGLCPGWASCHVEDEKESERK